MSPEVHEGEVPDLQQTLYEVQSELARVHGCEGGWRLKTAGTGEPGHAFLRWRSNRGRRGSPRGFGPEPRRL